MDDDVPVHVTVDLETLSLSRDAAIVPIGAILFSAYSAMGASPLWKLYHNRCYRTVNGLGYNLVPNNTKNALPHRAISDAIYQAERLLNLVAAMGINLSNDR